MPRLKKPYVILVCLLGSGIFAVAQMNPKYAAHVGGVWSGTIKKNVFLAHSGVGAYQKVTTEHWESISVDSFTLTVFRDTCVLFTFRNNGNVNSKDLKHLLNNIVAGDKVLIFDIYTMDLSRKKKLLLQPLEYLIE